eukprot:sb/3460475/
MYLVNRKSGEKLERGRGRTRSSRDISKRGREPLKCSPPLVYSTARAREPGSGRVVSMTTETVSPVLKSGVETGAMTMRKKGGARLLAANDLSAPTKQLVVEGKMFYPHLTIKSDFLKLSPPFVAQRRICAWQLPFALTFRQKSGYHQKEHNFGSPAIRHDLRRENPVFAEGINVIPSGHGSIAFSVSTPLRPAYEHISAIRILLCLDKPFCNGLDMDSRICLAAKPPQSCPRCVCPSSSSWVILRFRILQGSTLHKFYFAAEFLHLSFLHIPEIGTLGLPGLRLWNLLVGTLNFHLTPPWSMASIVMSMENPHSTEQADQGSFKKKTRRAPRKQKKSKKPYFKLTWEEKEELNERDRKLAEARLASSKISAPNNTTQFLMQEHKTATPNQTPVGMCYDSDDGGESLSGVSCDDQEEAKQSSGRFFENDFAETFDSMKADMMENKTRSELIEEIVNLDKIVTNLEMEKEKERFTMAYVVGRLRPSLLRTSVPVRGDKWYIDPEDMRNYEDTFWGRHRGSVPYSRGPNYDMGGFAPKDSSYPRMPFYYRQLKNPNLKYDYGIGVRKNYGETFHILEVARTCHTCAISYYIILFVTFVTLAPRAGTKTGGDKKGGGSAPGRVKIGNSMSLKNRKAKMPVGIRDKATVKRLNMYKTAGPKRNRDGQIVQAAEYQEKAKSGERARIEPNRKWFGNTRTLTQNALQRFQSEMGKIQNNPYQVVMKSSKVPTGLLQETAKTANVHILKTETFESTFGPKKLRKRPKLAAENLSEMVQKIATDTEKHDEKEVPAEDEPKDAPNDYIFQAGQSKRIHAELFKVIDSSDVVIQVLDARDPQGTRSKYVEHFLKTEKAHKHLVFVLNKCDLVPTWVTKGWLVNLSKEHPTLAFHATLKKSFGKGALINLLRQFSKLHGDKKQISVGFIGYPNVGKSSIINTLMHKKCCKVAPLAGETKVWQYVTLFKRVNLIDCPGVVSNTSDSNADMICKGVVRMEMVPNPSAYIDPIIQKIKPQYLTQAYKIEEWKDGEDFLAQLFAISLALTFTESFSLPRSLPPSLSRGKYSSDVVIQVLDARDPQGTRSKYVEHFLKTEKAHKHLVFVLNKCDLVPTWVTKGWLVNLSKEHPTLAFHATLKKSFGKGALINLLRQFSKLHGDKKQISVGFIGYPNVGKSSIINTLMHKKCCKVAPLAGETKVWQYVTLFKRVNLIDCPGVVSNTSDSNADMICKGVVRMEMVPNPSAYIDPIIQKIKPQYLTQAYKIEEWKDGEDFLAQLCKRMGKLLKKGEPDLDAVARIVFQDFQRGRLPYFNTPPNTRPEGEERPTDMSFIEDTAPAEVTEETTEGSHPAQRDAPEDVVLYQLGRSGYLRSYLHHSLDHYSELNNMPDSSSSRTRRSSPGNSVLFDLGQIKRRIKHQDTVLAYLDDYGYVNEALGGRMNHVTENDVMSSFSLMSVGDLDRALRLFQSMNYLPVTGRVDNEVIGLMRVPRCGVPDIEPNYFSAADHNKKRNGRRKRYVTSNDKWEQEELSFYIENYSSTLHNTVTREEMFRAMTVWAEHVPITFYEVEDPSIADIQISFVEKYHGDKYPFDGPMGVLAHAFYPRNGAVHFDNEENFTAHSKKGINFYYTAAHEFGHTLGLRLELAENYRAYLKEMANWHAPAPEGAECIEHIDAVFRHPRNKRLFFIVGDSYYQLERNKNKKMVVSLDFPKKLSDDFPALEGYTVDAAYTDKKSGMIHLFSGNQTWVYRFEPRELLPGYPKPRNETLTPEGVLGATKDKDDTIYFSPERGMEVYKNGELILQKPEDGTDIEAGLPMFVEGYYATITGTNKYFIYRSKTHKTVRVYENRRLSWDYNLPMCEENSLLGSPVAEKMTKLCDAYALLGETEHDIKIPEECYQIMDPFDVKPLEESEMFLYTYSSLSLSVLLSLSLSHSLSLSFSLPLSLSITHSYLKEMANWHAPAPEGAECIEHIDAVFRHPRNKRLFFIVGDSYYQLERNKNKKMVVSLDFPKKLSDDFPALEGYTVDAAYTDKKSEMIHLFSGNQTWVYRFEPRELLPGYPKPRNETLTPDGVLGATKDKDDTIYFSPERGMEVYKNGELILQKPEDGTDIEAGLPMFVEGYYATITGTNKYSIYRSKTHKTVRVYENRRLSWDYNLPMCEENSLLGSPVAEKMTKLCDAYALLGRQLSDLKTAQAALSTNARAAFASIPSLRCGAAVQKRGLQRIPMIMQDEQQNDNETGHNMIYFELQTGIIIKQLQKNKKTFQIQFGLDRGQLKIFIYILSVIIYTCSEHINTQPGWDFQRPLFPNFTFRGRNTGRIKISKNTITHTNKYQNMHSHTNIHNYTHTKSEENEMLFNIISSSSSHHLKKRENTLTRVTVPLKWAYVCACRVSSKILLRVSAGCVLQFCPGTLHSSLLTEFSNIFTFYWASGESLVLMISTHTHTLTHGHTHEKN